MVVVRSLRESLQALVRSPVVFLGGLAYAVVVTPQSALSLLGVPLAPQLLQVVTFFITPFVVAGTIGMAAEALAGDTSLSTLVDVGKDRYVTLLLGNLVEFGLMVVVGIVVLAVTLAVTFVVGFGVVAAGGLESGVGGALGAGTLAVVGLVGLALALLVVALFFFIQFYPVAIVYDGADAVDGFKRSYRLVRENLLSALGFSVVNLVVGILTGVPFLAVTLVRLQRAGEMGASGAGAGAGAGAPPTAGAFAGGVGNLFSLPEVAALTAVSLLTSTLLLAFRQTYATAFYRDVAEAGETSGARPAPADGPAPVEDL